MERIVLALMPSQDSSKDDATMLGHSFCEGKYKLDGIAGHFVGENSRLGFTSEDRPLYSAGMQYWLEHFAIAVSAISGVLAARGKKVDLFGVLVLALVTAFGGGTLRDLMVGDLPVNWVRDSSFLLTASVVAVLAFFLVRFYELPRNGMLVADAFALALFTVIGARKALAFQITPSVAIAMGVITGVAGGIIRDVLTGEIPLVFRPQIYLYATAALIGAAIFVLAAGALPNAHWPMPFAIAVVLGLRLAAIRWKLRLPVYQVKEAAAETFCPAEPVRVEILDK
jgi:uncharacterized membrane protein YeiH